MGYHMSQMDANFFIAAKDKEECLKAYKKKNKAFKGSSLEKAFQSYWFEPELDNDGNIIDLVFQGEKLNQFDDIFDAIAPYVKECSYLQMLGEDGDMWRWVFKGKTWHENRPTITW